MKVTAKPEQQSDSQSNQFRVDERLMNPGKYEISDESKFVVKLYLKKKQNRWILMSGPGEGVSEEEVVFRMWNFNEMIEMRKIATTFDQLRRVNLVDYDALNRLKVQKLMVSWTLDRDNPRLKLHHVNGVLTDEAWEVFSKRLLPNIAMYIIEEMNVIYERNG